MDYKTIPEIFFNQPDDKNALFEKKDQEYHGITYKELKKYIYKTIILLEDNNIKFGDKVAIQCDNCSEWVIVDQAIMSIGAIVIPIYPSSNIKTLNYILEHANAKLLFTNKKYLNSEISIKKIQIDRLNKNSEFQQKIKKIKKYGSYNKTLKPNDVATIVYTSGTTGEPKGVILTHHNIIENINSIKRRLPLTNQEKVLSFLPLSHVFERTAGYYTLISLGGEIYYAENMDTIGLNIQEIRPTIVISVPRLYEKIKLKMMTNMSPIKKKIFKWALKIGKLHKQNYSFRSKILYNIADFLVYRKIYKKLGGRLKFFVSGGAALSIDIAEFFESLGILILEGYGLTETSPVIACNHPNNYKFGTVGQALDCNKIKLLEDGELCVKGANVTQGYYKLINKSAVFLDNDGWLHTGDIARIDNDNFIQIIDRKKDIIVLSTGKNIAPQPIENKIKESPYVEQILLCGNQKKYISALIVVNKEKIQEFAIKNKISYHKNEELLNNKKINDFIFNEILKLQKNHSDYEKIKKIQLLNEEFKQEKNEVTPTLKLIRKTIEKNYKMKIGQMYNE